MILGLTTFLMSAGAATFLSFAITWYQKKKSISVLLKNERKLRKKILSSSDASWRKVGSVKELILYPLKSAKGKSVNQCDFGKYGISVNENYGFPIKDRMFMIYDEKTMIFQSLRQHPKLVLVSVSPVDNNRAILEAPDVTSLVFDLPKHANENANVVECYLWKREPVMCLDCGPEASAWLSKLLIGSDCGLKLAFYITDYERKITQVVPWDQYAKFYNFRDEDTGLLAVLASYMLLSDASIDDLNQRLKKPIRPLQLRPNIVVEGCEPYAEDEWEWVKIGKDVIIRYVKPCTRCVLTRVDPDTGVTDKSEPLRTLTTQVFFHYRKLKNADQDALEEHSPALGIYCGLYRAGVVRLSDDVYVYIDPMCNEH